MSYDNKKTINLSHQTFPGRSSINWSHQAFLGCKPNTEFTGEVVVFVYDTSRTYNFTVPKYSDAGAGAVYWEEILYAVTSCSLPPLVSSESSLPFNGEFPSLILDESLQNFLGKREDDVWTLWRRHAGGWNELDTTKKDEIEKRKKERRFMRETSSGTINVHQY